MNGSLLRGRLQVRILPGSPFLLLITYTYMSELKFRSRHQEFQQGIVFSP